MATGMYDANLLGKGSGGEAIRLLLRYPFTDLDLYRIGVRMLAYNQRAIRGYEKCGFIVEGESGKRFFSTDYGTMTYQWGPLIVSF
jgi:RimJ/RimL family protein N-acetyltransferase